MQKILLSKKGASLTFQTIIIAALAVIVLVVLLYLLLGASQGADSSTKCALKGGICKESCDNEGEGIYTRNLGDDLCSNSDDECCGPGV